MKVGGKGEERCGVVGGDNGDEGNEEGEDEEASDEYL